MFYSPFALFMNPKYPSLFGSWWMSSLFCFISCTSWSVKIFLGAIFLGGNCPRTVYNEYVEAKFFIYLFEAFMKKQFAVVLHKGDLTLSGIFALR